MKVMDPAGRTWKITRRWSPRAATGMARRLRRQRQRFGGTESAAATAGGLSDVSPVFGAIAALIAIVVLIFFVMPLLVEALIVLAIMGLSILARVVLRRPWTIEAVTGEERIEHQAVGWRAGGLEITAMADAIRAGTLSA